MNLGGLLLTGGSSRRMGVDKAGLPFAGRSLARMAAEALRNVADPVLVVGHRAGTGLEDVADPRQGPLSAVVAGADALAAHGHTGHLLVLAGDMPFVTPGLLGLLAVSVGVTAAALPESAGRDQPLCACYAPSAIDEARRLVADGARAMHELVSALPDVVRVPEEEWQRVAPPYALLDVDSPEDLAEAERILDAPA